MRPTFPFRCESCGYHLEGVAEAELCQECGKPVAESRPEWRPGLPWQRLPSLGSYIATVWLYLTHPVRAYRLVRIEPRRSRLLFFTNLFVAFCIGLVPLMVGAVLGARNLVVIIAPGAIFEEIDAVPPLLLLIGCIAYPLTIPFVFIASRFVAPRQRPPLAPAVPWCSASLTSCCLLPATGSAVAMWLMRYLMIPPEPIRGPIPPFYPALSLSTFVVYCLFMFAAGAIDMYANRANRLANQLEDR
jgi:hypothetical protein